MKRVPWYLGVVLILSCPNPITYTIMPMPDADLIREAAASYQTRPHYSLELLERVTGKHAQAAKNLALCRLYLDQREYVRAAALIDSCGPDADFGDYEIHIALSRARRWPDLAVRARNSLLQSLARYRSGDYSGCRGTIRQDTTMPALRTLYLARSFVNLDLCDSALAVLAAVDSIPRYLQDDYRDLLLELLPSSRNVAAVKKQMDLLKDPALREYALLKYYEKHRDRAGQSEAAWKLIRQYPGSAGALHALDLVHPQTPQEHRSCGLAYYNHGRYGPAVTDLEQAPMDASIRFYLGRAHYELKSYGRALSYLAALGTAEALYYQGRIHENKESFDLAIVLYDSLYRLHPRSKYALYGLRQKAFLLEDLGDTLKAVEAFLKINERNTKFRAALQLYRLGRLNEAAAILAGSSDPEYVYWQIRVRERLAQPVDSLKAFLSRQYPLSYYSLLKNRTRLPVDTLPFDRWLVQLGDTAVSFDRPDSLRIARAIAYFEIGETKFGIAELALLDPLSVGDLRYLNELCDRYGADRPAINYALTIKERAEQKGIYAMPVGLFRRIYPVRYLLSIRETGLEASLILALLWQESLFDPDAVSTADARGLMQIIPETGAVLASQLGIAPYSLFDAGTSIRFGTQYLRDLKREFNSNILALAGYNAGPVTVRRWLKKNPNSETDEFVELIPYSETRNYLKYILARQIIYKNLLDSTD